MPVSGCRPVQLKLAVSDVTIATSFFEAAFGLKASITRRTDEEDFYGFVFGDYGQPSFFLIHLVNPVEDFDRPASSTIGLLVDDVDRAHARACGRRNGGGHA